MGKTRDLFKKMRDTKVTFHAKMGLIKDRNDMDLTEAEDIKKRWQEYTEELCKKYLNDPDNHDGVITHQEPDIPSLGFSRQEYTEELYKKDLHDPDNHNGVITDLEPDILKCEVKWAFGSITMNKASGGDGIPVELFQILKDDAVKVLYSICHCRPTVHLLWSTLCK